MRGRCISGQWLVAKIPAQTCREVRTGILRQIKNLDRQEDRVSEFIRRCEQLADAISTSTFLAHDGWISRRDQNATRRNLLLDLVQRTTELQSLVGKVGADNDLIIFLGDEVSTTKLILDRLDRSAKKLLTVPAYSDTKRRGNPGNGWRDSTVETAYRDYVYCFDKPPPTTNTSGFYLCIEWLLAESGEELGGDYLKSWMQRRAQSEPGYQFMAPSRFGD